MRHAPVCQHCHLPISAGEFSRVAGHTVYVHRRCLPRCLVQRANRIEQNREHLPPLVRRLAQALLLGQARSRPSGTQPSPKPDLRVIK
jgi:hypothetical protein